MDDWEKMYENGTIGGMSGMLIRHEVDLGGTAMFMIENRLDEIKYIPLNIDIR